MSYDLHDGTVHAWATNPTPPATTWRQRLTQWIGLDSNTATEHVGADAPTWEQELRAMRLDHADAFDAALSAGRHYAHNIATTVIRRPIAAITATPHHAYVDPDLGPLDLGPLEPAYLAGETKGAEQ
ncbi:hypothetical protein GAR05_06118 [Micromonospora saelicesensis]|uniref:Uncharacterized protein n=1 Tax=Micromonospora saelicesensis TaxID=285676 RepID=A0ABX9CAV8_9ACTN|nr:hypothetical protein [Micromonospora saelicesensis]RAN92626.1 hypothetical protein GAR05_06118 [Micromonospora saelicesensis]